MKTFENLKSVAANGKPDDVINRFVASFLQREKLKEKYRESLSEDDCFDEHFFDIWLKKKVKADDFVPPEITGEDIEAVRRANYTMFRAGAYPDQAIYLDAVVKGDAEQEQEYKDLCAAVKERFPK